MTSAFDIVSIYNNAPLVGLTDKYTSPMLNEINEFCNTEDKQIFTGSFFGYLNYNTVKYPIYLDNIFSWLGFARKTNCKKLLTDNFKENEDYIIKDEEDLKIVSSENIEKVFPTAIAVGKISSENIETRGGSGKEHIYMTIKCFKKLCMKARTDRADTILDYYVKLEEIIMKTVHQQAIDFSNLLMLKDQQIENIVLQKDQEIEDLQDMVENNISKHEQDLINLAKDKRVLYLGIVEEIITMIGVTKYIETRVKFGISKGIDRRVLREHKVDFDTFTLKYVFVTDFNAQLEDLIKDKCKDKTHILYNRRFSKTYGIKKQTELIRLDDKFTLNKLIEVITKLKENCDQDDISKKDKEYRLMKQRLALRGELGDVLGTKDATSIDADYIKYIEIERKYNDLKNKIKNNEEVILSDDEEEVVIDEHKGYSFCSGCKDWHLVEEFATNKRTHKLYTECTKSKEQKLKDRELVEKNNKQFLENQKRALKFQEFCDQLIEDIDPFECHRCRMEKEASFFGVNEITQQVHGMCIKCRDEVYKHQQKEEEEVLILEEGVTFKCTVPYCNKISLIEFDPVNQRNYSTCTTHRNKDLINREKNAKEYEEFLKNPELNIACLLHF